MQVTKSTIFMDGKRIVFYFYQCYLCVMIAIVFLGLWATRWEQTLTFIPRISQTQYIPHLYIYIHTHTL